MKGKELFLRDDSKSQGNPSSEAIAVAKQQSTSEKVNQSSGRRSRMSFLFKKLRSQRHLRRTPSKKEQSVTQTYNSDFSENNCQLPYPDFSSPLEDISFSGLEASTLWNCHQSTECYRGNVWHSDRCYSRTNALFSAWNPDYVMRPPSSPMVTKSKWFTRTTKSSEEFD